MAARSFHDAFSFLMKRTFVDENRCDILLANCVIGFNRSIRRVMGLNGFYVLSASVTFKHLLILLCKDALIVIEILNFNLLFCLRLNPGKVTNFSTLFSFRLAISTLGLTTFGFNIERIYRGFFRVCD